MYTYYFDHSKPYSNRHEKRLHNPDGSDAAPMLITRYTFGYKWRTRGVTGPRGGKARQERKFNVFYKGGVFYKNKNIVSEDGKKLNSFETFEGILHDAFPTASKKQGVPVVTIECIEGIPVSVKDAEGADVWAWGINTIAELEDMLRIPEQDRAIAEEAESIEEAATTEELEQQQPEEQPTIDTTDLDEAMAEFNRACDEFMVHIFTKDNGQMGFDLLAA